jgi:arylsulfatase A-like enzyme
MKHLLILLASLTLLCAFAIQGHAAEPSRPNLLIILTDDMGYADLKAFGDSEIPAPHLDRLAAEGTRCTSAYVVASVCVPSRMGLMTGRFPARFGVYENAHNERECRIWLQQTTLADVLKQSGYRTANIGKWHLSGNSLEIKPEGGGGFLFKPPHERGFDEFVGITGGMHDFWKGTPLARLKDGKYERFESPEYLTDFFGTEAVEFIERTHTKNQGPGTKSHGPFFLYLAFNAVHAPLHGLPEDQKAIESARISPDRRKYAAMLRAVDRNVGRVMDRLRELGLAENTLTVFLNDNGGGGNNYKGGTRNTAINRPFRGHKFDLWEGGVRVPFIVHWPGQVSAGKKFDGIVSSLDVFPTFAKVAGASAQSDSAKAETTLPDGVDLLPFLKSEATGDPHDHLCWQQEVRIRPNDREPGPGFPNPAFNLAIRSGKWKAIKQDQPYDGSNTARPWELYDLSRDPSELNDLATEFPEITERLAKQFRKWQSQMHPPLVPLGKKTVPTK